MQLQWSFGWVWSCFDMKLSKNGCVLDSCRMRREGKIAEWAQEINTNVFIFVYSGGVSGGRVR